MWRDHDGIYYDKEVVDERVINVIVVYMYERKKQLSKKMYIAKKTTNT